jgi:hypothetical protein
MARWVRAAACAAIGAAIAGVPASWAQTTPGYGRISLFGSWSRTTQSGTPSYTFTDVSASVALRSSPADEGGAEYAVDMRGATFPSTSERENEYSIYDAYVGGSLPGGSLGLRAGQMWLNELGSLGSFAGVLLRYRQPEPWGIGRLRAGLFGGLEPKILQAGYEKDIRKFGGFLALDGENARSHVFGYARIRNAGQTERSVLTMTNFIPIGRTFFLYQGAEYDLEKPGGLGRSGLNYLFVNVRYSPISRVEFQGLYHHGRSIDARTISEDLRNGRPVDSITIEGFLFESAGGRVSVEVLPSVRLIAGYSRERDNQNDTAYGRTTFGLWAADIFRSGFDVTVSDSRSNRPGGGYDSWYASLGRNLGGRFYVSADYSTSLSILRIFNTDGVLVESQPRSKRYSLYGLWNVDRHFSLMLTGERLKQEGVTDNRVLLGIVYRF